MRVKLDKIWAQIFLGPRQSHYKGTDKSLRYHNWTSALEINTAAYMRGPSTKAISYSSFYTQVSEPKKKRKTPSISERYELSISQPRFILVLRLRPSSSSSLRPLPLSTLDTAFPISC